MQVELRDCPPGYLLRPWLISPYEQCTCNSERPEILDCEGQRILLDVSLIVASDKSTVMHSISLYVIYYCTVLLYFLPPSLPPSLPCSLSSSLSPFLPSSFHLFHPLLSLSSMQGVYWATKALSSSSMDQLFLYACPPGYCRCTTTRSTGVDSCPYVYKNGEPSFICSCSRQGEHTQLYSGGRLLCIELHTISTVPQVMSS